MKKHIFIAKAKDGKLDWGSEVNEARLRDVLKNNPDKTFRLEMVENKRSLAQNAFYWLYLTVIERETGDDAQSLHELFKRKFLKPKFLKVRDIEIKIPASTTELSKSEMGEYLDRICAETSIPIPDRELAGYYV